MAFVDKMIGRDEEIIARANPHWIYIVQGILLLISFLILGHFLDHEIKEYIRYQLAKDNESQVIWLLLKSINYIFYSCMIIGGFIFLLHFIYYRSTHIVITSDRLIYKTGMFFVNVHESSLEEIKGEVVHNGFFGRFLNYGFVEIDCRFVDNMYLPAIYSPYAFLHDLHKISKAMKHETFNNDDYDGFDDGLDF